MTEKQRSDHMKRVANTKVIVSSIAVDPSVTSPVADLEASKHLSVDVNTVAASVSVPLECLKGILQKAEELRNSQHGMSPAPGQPEEARMVLSCSGKRPHLVLPSKGGRFKCDSDCLNFKYLGICSHSVAVAECNNLLTEFLAHFQKAKKRSPTLLLFHCMGFLLVVARKVLLFQEKGESWKPLQANVWIVWRALPHCQVVVQ